MHRQHHFFSKAFIPVWLILLVLILHSGLCARIGTYASAGVGMADSLFGIDLELQVYNFSATAGFGSYNIADPSKLVIKPSFGIRGYLNDADSGPYLAFIYSADFYHAYLKIDDVSVYDKYLPVYTVLAGYRWLLNNFLFGEYGAKYCISLGIGAAFFPPTDDMPEVPNNVYDNISVSKASMPMPIIELRIGSGWLFMPWEE